MGSNVNVDGMKNRHYGGRGYNLVASATQRHALISVVLGTKTDRIRFNESEKMLTWGFRFYETVTPIKPMPRSSASASGLATRVKSISGRVKAAR